MRRGIYLTLLSANELLMKKTLLGVGALAVLGAVALPAATFAATYAYVNNAGEVMTMDASDANTAIMTAPNIAPRSGVMLIETTSDEEVVGDRVQGA